MAIASNTPFLLWQENDSEFGVPNASQFIVGAGLSLTQTSGPNTTTLTLTEAPEGLIGAFLANGGVYAKISGYETVTYTMSAVLQAFLATSPAPTGALSIVLPLSLTVTSPGSSFSVKVAIGTNLFIPSFNGSGLDYSVTLTSVNSYDFTPAGTTLYVPLTSVVGAGVTQLIVYVQNATATPYVGSFSSSTVVATTGSGVQ